MKHQKMTNLRKGVAGIEWENIYHRLEIARAGAEQTRVPTTEEIKKF